MRFCCVEENHEMRTGGIDRATALSPHWACATVRRGEATSIEILFLTAPRGFGEDNKRGTSSLRCREGGR